MDRRAFLEASSLAAATSLHWLRSGGLLGQIAQAAPTEPTAATNGAFIALVKAILPFDDPRFAALSPAAVSTRANALFGIAQDAAISGNLAVFDELALFASPPGALTSAELVLYPAPTGDRSQPATVEARIAADAKSYQVLSARWNPAQPTFSSLPLQEQRAYVMLWARSDLGVRRRFYRAMKSLIMAAAYSMDEAWSVIGYAGPLLHFRSP
ncbi:MAG: hypothetical protein JO219_08500 [Candidatus Eremiobacteraeota bacterium]|nr:hypothetical protein [Candidatus Eremiobacteraeota bacterium]